METKIKAPTKREILESSLARIAKMLGKTSGNPWTRTEAGNRASIGCLSPDYNAVYGGWIIEEIVNEAGGVRHPFNNTRLPFPQMREVLYGIERALELSKGGR